jgi:hypothetical protein
MRLWIVTAVCRLMRHPTRQSMKDGVMFHECLCGHDLYSGPPSAIR